MKYALASRRKARGAAQAAAFTRRIQRTDLLDRIRSLYTVCETLRAKCQAECTELETAQDPATIPRQAACGGKARGLAVAVDYIRTHFPEAFATSVRFVESDAPQMRPQVLITFVQELVQLTMSGDVPALALLATQKRTNATDTEMELLRAAICQERTAGLQLPGFFPEEY